MENCEQEDLILEKKTWSVKVTRWGRGQRPTGVTVGAERPFLGVFPCTGHFGSHNLVQQALASLTSFHREGTQEQHAWEAAVWEGSN